MINVKKVEENIRKVVESDDNFGCGCLEKKGYQMVY
jgi:hypothetical protein